MTGAGTTEFAHSCHGNRSKEQKTLVELRFARSRWRRSAQTSIRRHLRLVYAYDASTRISTSISHVWTGTTRAPTSASTRKMNAFLFLVLASPRFTRGLCLRLCLFLCLHRTRKPAFWGRKTRTHCAVLKMLTRFATRATFMADTNFVSRAQKMFLMAARRATMFPRFATDGQHRRTQCCRCNMCPRFSEGFSSKPAVVWLTAWQLGRLIIPKHVYWMHPIQSCHMAEPPLFLIVLNHHFTGANTVGLK